MKFINLITFKFNVKFIFSIRRLVAIAYYLKLIKKHKMCLKRSIRAEKGEEEEEEEEGEGEEE
jgi:hypothetical protein